MKYSPEDYAQLLYRTRDYEGFLQTVKDHWVSAWLPQILASYERLLRKKERIIEATIQSAHELDAKTKDALGALVKKYYPDFTVRLNFTVDPSLLGGFYVQSDYILIPASLRDKVQSFLI